MSGFITLILFLAVIFFELCIAASRRNRRNWRDDDGTYLGPSDRSSSAGGGGDSGFFDLFDICDFGGDGGDCGGDGGGGD